MKVMGRTLMCLGLLSLGVAAQAGLERWSRIERPALRRELTGLPLALDGWTGAELAVDPKVLAEAQATEFVSRSYTNPKFPGVALSLWINYSVKGDNMRHSPEICLPSHGGSKIESQTRVLPIAAPGGRDVNVTRLGYSQGEVVQGVGFWYYIFGEGAVERWVRGLPITSRSSHGRPTRGSAFRDFARAVLGGLEPILPLDRAEYHVP